MQNDVLKNEIAPWQEKGRWYHGVYDYATSSFIADQTDDLINQNGSVSNVGTAIVLSVTDHIIHDVKASTKDVTIGSAQTLTYMGRRYYTSGKFSVIIGPTSTTGTNEFWAFIE